MCDRLLVEPLAIRMRRRQLALDLLVVDDAALSRCRRGRCGPGAGGSLTSDVLGRDVEHADLGRHDDEVVLGDVVARRPQAVAVEARRRSRVPSVNAIEAGPSHGSISDEWYS